MKMMVDNTAIFVYNNFGYYINIGIWCWPMLTILNDGDKRDFNLTYSQLKFNLFFL